MATVCYTRATLTSTRVSTGYSVVTTHRNVAYTSPGRTYVVPYTTTLCVGRVCTAYVTARYSISPGSVYTSQVEYYTSVPVRYTNQVTLYSTSCSVSQRPAPAPTPPPTATSYVTTTTTQTSPGDNSPTLSSSRSQSTVFGSTETPEPKLGPESTTGTSEPRKLPVGAIVGGVLGGLVAATLLGFIIYFLLFKKSRKGSNRDSREHLDHQRPLSTTDGQSSPSEVSSALQPQMQEYGARHSVHSGQGHGYQYSHLRQDSVGGATGQYLDGSMVPMAVAAMRVDQTSPDPGTGWHTYSQPGQYLGHAEVQDSRLNRF